LIQSFADAGTEDLFHGRSTKAARQTCSQSVWRVAGRKLDRLDSAGELGDLRVPPGNRLEALVGDRAGPYSIRVNHQYRICFEWGAQGPINVEIIDCH